MPSHSIHLARRPLGQTVEVTMDHPLGSKHPKQVHFQEQWFKSEIIR